MGPGMGIPTLCLDLSAAFDMLNIGQLLRTLEISYGVQGTVLAWMISYLTGRSQCTGIANDVVLCPAQLWSPSRIHSRASAVFYYTLVHFGISSGSMV